MRRVSPALAVVTVAFLMAASPAGGEFSFKVADRVFQVAVCLGPRPGRPFRARVAALLDSLRVAPQS